jgi:hypothetical protein
MNESNNSRNLGNDGNTMQYCGLMKYMLYARIILLFSVLFVQPTNSQVPKADFDFIVVYECGYAFVGIENKSSNTDSSFWDLNNTGNYIYRINPNLPIGNLTSDKDFIVSLIVKGDGLTDSITKNFSLRQTRVEFEYKTQDSSNFAPVTIEFINKSFQRNGDTLTYLWDFNDGNTSGEENPFHNYSIPGTYLPILSGITQNGCFLYSFLPITARDTAQKNEIDYITGYHTTNTNYPFEQFDTIQNEILKITGYRLLNCCTTKTAVIYKSLDTIFIKTFETGPKCTCNDFFDFEIKVTGIYRDSIYVSFDGQVVNAKKILTSIDSKSINELPKIYPNPINENFKIEMPNGHKYDKIRIINIYGENISEYNIESMGLIEINRKSLPGGIYFLVFSDRIGNTKTEKVIFK